MRNLNGERGKEGECVEHSPRGGLRRSSYGEALRSAVAAAAAVSRLLICTHTHKINQTSKNTCM